MREANLRTRQVKAQEELKDATFTVEKCREQLARAREQVSSQVIMPQTQLTGQW